MKVPVYIAIFSLATSVAFSQVGYREKDPDGKKFAGTWRYESSDKAFSISFSEDNLRLGVRKDGSPIRMEVLMGTWWVKDAQGERRHVLRYTAMGRTIQNPNVLEGGISDYDYGIKYYFTLELVDTNRAVWKITETRKLSNPEAGAILISPPTECILTKKATLLFPPELPGPPETDPPSSLPYTP